MTEEDKTLSAYEDSWRMGLLFVLGLVIIQAGAPGFPAACERNR